MNQLYSSGPIKGLLFNDHPLPDFPHRRKIVFPTNIFVPQANQPPAVPWLVKRGAVKTAYPTNQPGFNTVNRGGDHD